MRQKTFAGIVRGVGLGAFTAALLTSGMAMADAHDKFSGPYMGAHGGYSFGEVRNHDSNGGDDVSLTGLNGGLHAGYGRTVTPEVYTGLEVAHSWSTADGSAHNADFEKARDYGVSLRVGYIADEDTMVYGKAGYQRAAFEMENERDWRDGARVGAGIQHFVHDDVSLRAEYDYTHYFKNKGRDTFKDAADSQVSVGVSYHF